MTKRVCGAGSLLRYTWPGRDEAFVCVEHANGILRVAEAMGLHLQMILLLPEQLASAPICSSMVEDDRVDGKAMLKPICERPGIGPYPIGWNEIGAELEAEDAEGLDAQRRAVNDAALREQKEEGDANRS